MAPVSRSTALHYVWGGTCDGWKLLDAPDLSVIEERMPPLSQEVKHIHDRANQVFYVLEGTLTIEVDGKIERVRESEALHVPPGSAHQVRNDALDTDARFIVISAPTTQGDRRPA